MAGGISVGQLQEHKNSAVDAAAADDQLVVVAVVALLEDRQPATDDVVVENPVQRSKQL